MIYAVEAPLVGAVKIGFSDDPVRRMRTLQTDSPIELVLVGVCDGGREREAALHRAFARYWIRGEWFRSEGAVANFVAQMDAPPRRRVCQTWPVTKLGGVFGTFSCGRCGKPFERRWLPSRPPLYCSKTCSNKRNQGPVSAS